MLINIYLQVSQMSWRASSLQVAYMVSVKDDLKGKVPPIRINPEPKTSGKFNT